MIYSIFYISVASNIRNYGQLRTIGTTKRQIKKMVYREGKLLAAAGISIGLIIGNVIGYFLIPEGWYWLTSLCVTIGCGLFAFTMVMLSIHTPVKKAASVSPMEALRYSDYKGKPKESSALYRKITPASLAKMNLSRQKTKSILTIFSLAFGGVLVVLISTILVSYDGVAEARGRDFSKGEFNINLNANQSFDTAKVSLTKLQQKNMLNDNFVKTIEAIDGVTGIKRWYYTDAEYRVNGISEDWIQGFSQDEQSDLEKNLIKGTADYDELIADNGIILLQERADLSGMDVALGDTVEVDYENVSGDIMTKTYTVKGIVSDYNYTGFDKCFTLPEQLINEGTGMDCTGTISVITDKDKFDTVKGIVSDYNYTGFDKCFTLPEQLINEGTGMDCTGTISVITDKDKFDTIETSLNQLIDKNSDLVMDTIEESVNYYNRNQQLVFGAFLIVAIIVVIKSADR